MTDGLHLCPRCERVWIADDLDACARCTPPLLSTGSPSGGRDSPLPFLSSGPGRAVARGPYGSGVYGVYRVWWGDGKAPRAASLRGPFGGAFARAGRCCPTFDRSNPEELNALRGP